MKAKWIQKFTHVYFVGFVLAIMFWVNFSTAAFCQVENVLTSKDSVSTQVKSSIKKKTNNIKGLFGQSKEQIDSQASLQSMQIPETNFLDSSRLDLSPTALISDSTKFPNANKSIPQVSSPNTSLDSQLKGDLVRKSLDFIKAHSSLTSTITSESFITNYQDPFTVSEKIYSRLYGSPTLQLGGLPLICDFFVTTEPNNLYNSNSFNVRFDVEQYKNNLLAKSKQKVSNLEKEKDNLKKLKFSNEKERAKLDMKLAENLKKQDIHKKALSQKLNLPLDSFLAIDFNKHFPNRNLDKNMVDTSGLRDSLAQQYGFNDEDFALYETYLKLDSERNALAYRYAQADSMYSVIKGADSTLTKNLKAAKESFSNINPIAKKVGDKSFGGRFNKIFNQVEYFEVGVNYPYFSDYSLNGIPVKGLNIGISGKSHTVKIVGGRTFDNRFNTFGMNQPKPDFTRNVQGLYFSRKWRNSEFGISNTSLWDKQNTEAPKQNFVQCLNFSKELGSKLIMEFSTAHSVYASQPIVSVAEEGLAKPSFALQRLNQSAGEIKAKYQIDGKSKLKLDAKRIYPGFINLSNPYMRNGYDEFRVDLDRKMFKRKIQSSIFYKHFADNITHIQQATNKMQGYGISIRSNFKKVPNFYLQHAPYEQGNNHPDSMFRTNNQLSVSSAGLSYIWQKDKLKLSIMSNVTRSQIDFNNNQLPIENLFYNAMIFMQKGSASISLNGYRNQSKPIVDSLNFTGLRIEFTQKLSKIISISTSFFWDQYDSDDYRYNCVNALSATIFKSLNLKAGFGIGKINGLYGIEKKSIYSGSMVLSYTL